jgi:lipopolysaccharide biosynthesis glycosyltransferase
MTDANKRSVVMCFDRGYGSAACVTLTSLFLNSPNTEFQVDLLQLDTDPALDDALQKLAVTFNREIHQHHVDKNLLSNFHISNHVTQTAYLRFYIPKFLQTTKALYLDCDVIVQCDVGVLFSIDLAPETLVAGVEDLTGSAYAKAKLGLSDVYINSGVLLFNPLQWQKTNITAQLVDYYSDHTEKITWHDQCVINGALSGRKQTLDYRFNLLLNDLQSQAIQYNDFSEDTFEGVFHFNSTVKPWHRWCDQKYKALWDKYAKVSPCAPKEIMVPRDYSEWQMLAQHHESCNAFREANAIYRELLAHNQGANLFERHRALCSQKVATLHHNTVQHGLMKGMRFSESGWGQADKGSMILGLYEREISDAIASIDDRYDVLVDVGSADGYYGVGLLVNQNFSESYCFEVSDDGQRILANNALANNVAERVHIFGKAEKRFYQQLPQDVLDRSVVIVDVEGYEFELLDSETFSAFHNAILFVELHDWFFSDADDLRKNLLNAASKTHTPTYLTTGARDLSHLEELRSWTDTDRWLLCSEGRGRLMTWIRFDPTAQDISKQLK